MPKAYGYIRCSGLTQMEHGGPERQRQAIQEYADAHELEIVRWFEESHTGTDLEGRPQFREMRQELLNDGVRVVIVEKLDRLARSIMIQENIIADFTKYEINLVSATPGEENLCGDDPTRTFIRQVLGAVAEFDRSMLVARMKAGKNHKKRAGGFGGGNYGYGQHPFFPEEKDVVAKIMEARHSFTIRELTAELNRGAIKTRSGGLWHPAQVARILKANK